MSLYNQVFRDLCDVIRRDHPMSAALLQALRAVSSVKEACYAGLFLIAEEYRNAVPNEDVRRAEIFYDPLEFNQPAVDLFNELILCYQTEVRTKYLH
jgi:hypothetical protein